MLIRIVIHHQPYSIFRFKFFYLPFIWITALVTEMFRPWNLWNFCPLGFDGIKSWQWQFFFFYNFYCFISLQLECYDDGRIFRGTASFENISDMVNHSWWTCQCFCRTVINSRLVEAIRITARDITNPERGIFHKFFKSVQVERKKTFQWTWSCMKVWADSAETS